MADQILSFMFGLITGLGVVLLFQTVILYINRIDEETLRQQHEQVGDHLNVTYYPLTDEVIAYKHGEIVATVQNVFAKLDRYHQFGIPEIGGQLVKNAGSALTSKEKVQLRRMLAERME